MVTIPQGPMVINSQAPSLSVPASPPLLKLKFPERKKFCAWRLVRFRAPVGIWRINPHPFIGLLAPASRPAPQGRRTSGFFERVERLDLKHAALGAGDAQPSKALATREGPWSGQTTEQS
jgi:hypothetical protein